MELPKMKKESPSKNYGDSVSKAMHRSTITMTLVLLVFGVMILPWSDPSSAAFVPLVLSMIISLLTLVNACFSLNKQIKKEKQRKAEMGLFENLLNNFDQQQEESNKDD
jgi:hypothetical protein